jgi:DNA repair photolyase
VGNLRWQLADEPKAQGSLFEAPVFEREPGRGEFRGMEFLHVKARSIINEVPNAPFGFQYTINAYRGCSHACTYCLVGDTAILMADGTTRPLADLRAGDAVYGIEQQGVDVRLVPTTVLDHWSTVKPAFRVTLRDGTELVSSGDHRFLTARGGWKHVVSTGAGRGRRPHLTTGDALVGVGRAAADLAIAAIEPLGVDLPMFDISTGTGDFIANGVVSHNCFARPTHTFLDLDAGDDFERKIVVKVNAVSLLRSELDPRKWAGGLIAMGTNTDPYQRCEGKYRLTRGIVEVLAEHANPFSILTKSTLVLRDRMLLAEAARRTSVRVNLSIGTLDENVWRATEPGTPHPLRRVRAVEALNASGIPCGVLIGPVLPQLSDGPEQLEAVVKACVEAGAQSISTVLLHLRPGVKEVFLPRLADTHPELVDEYQQLYGNRAYAPRTEQRAVERMVRGFVHQYAGVSADRLDPRHHTGLPGPASGDNGNGHGDDDGHDDGHDGEGDDDARPVRLPAPPPRRRRRPHDTGTQLSLL